MHTLEVEIFNTHLTVWTGENVAYLVGPEKMKKSKADGDYSRTQRG